MDYAQSELIPSLGKEAGWKHFQAAKPELLAANTPTSQLLLRLHHTLTSHYPQPTLPPEVLNEMRGYLIIQDRPDAERFTEIGIQKTEEARVAQPDCSLVELDRILWRAYVDAANDSTRVNFQPRFHGSLRSYGTRSIDGGPEEVVYATHTRPFYSPAAQFGVVSPDFYYGLTVGLGEIHEKLCAAYDRMMAEAATLDQRLLANSFLQLIGTRVLHPLWDANGRTFAAHLALSLEREGISLQDYEQLHQLTQRLTPVNEEFFTAFRNEGGIPLISGESHLIIKYHPGAGKDYMGRLRGTLEAAIESGLDSSNPFSLHFHEGAEAIGRFVADLQQRPYRKGSYPKQAYLEKAITDPSKQVGLWSNPFDIEWSVIGIKDEKGGVIKIGLDDLMLNDAERKAVGYARRLYDLKNQVDAAVYGPICAKKLDMDDTRLAKFLDGRIKSRRRLHRSAYFLAGVLGSQYVELGRFVEKGRNLWKQLYEAGASLHNTVLVARARGKPLQEFNPMAREGAQRLVKLAEDYLAREVRIMAKRKIPGDS